MPLETFEYIDSLVPSNPPVTDGIVQGDDHLRGIKLTIIQTFPNITGPVTATHGALNTVAGWFTSGVNLLAHVGTFFDNGSGAASTDGFLNTIAGDIDIQLQGVTSTTFQRTAGVNFLKHTGQIQVTGGISATQEIKGPGITPIGGTIIWWDDTLPTDGLWVWANGQIISNANTVCPILLARWGNRFGGDGITTMGVPNLQEVVPVGKSGMGGATAPNLLTSIASNLKGAVNAIFGADTHMLTTNEMPSHYHSASIYDPTHTHPLQNNYITNGQGSGIGGGGSFGVPTSGLYTAYAGTGVRVNSSNGIDTTNSTGGGQPHSIVQPSKAVNWIIRIG